MAIIPYLGFHGKASEAIDYYEKVFKGQDKQVMRFSDLPANPDYPMPEEQNDWVGHASMSLCGAKVYFGDQMEPMNPSTAIALLIELDTVEEVQRIYDELRKEGEVLIEITPTFYAKMYAWVKDKYGVNWQLICE